MAAKKAEKTLPVTMDYPEDTEVEIKHKLAHLNYDLGHLENPKDAEVIQAKIGSLESKLLNLLQDEAVFKLRSVKEQRRAKAEVARIQAKGNLKPDKPQKKAKVEDEG
jgi:hypothetical protein